MATSSDDSMDWLKALEQKADAVAQELASLRKKNRSLLSKVNRLEREAREKGNAGAESWDAERAQIRERVEKLAEGLEELIEEE